jgi:hypothetical protein
MLFSNRTIIILFAVPCTALAAALPDPDSSQIDLTRRSYARLAYRSPGPAKGPPTQPLITLDDLLVDSSLYPPSPNGHTSPGPSVQDVRAIAILRL